MFVLISPAKKQDFESLMDAYASKRPIPFEFKTTFLLSNLKKYSEDQLSKVLSVSNQLAKLNHQRFKEFDLAAKTKSALFAYQGDVYQFMDPKNWDDKALESAKNRLLIVSAMYGILRANTQIAAYRLEMINHIGEVGSLVKYWSEEVTSYMNGVVQGDIVLNLASKAYSEVVDRKKFKSQIVDVDFLEESPDGRLRTIAVNAKRARGLMVKAIMHMHAPSIEGLKSLSVRGYRFDDSLSDESKLVFVKYK
ncbi:MAG: YaaA family protein [Gammaproteobacteria bacterium]|nr:YaaA family protein [Gammaproteobacteria bacterium]